jgi:hypothetical protein
MSASEIDRLFESGVLERPLGIAAGGVHHELAPQPA